MSKEARASADSPSSHQTESKDESVECKDTQEVCATERTLLASLRAASKKPRTHKQLQQQPPMTDYWIDIIYDTHKMERL